MGAELPELVVADAKGWRKWLSRHYADDSGVWLVLAKKGTTDPTSLDYETAVLEAVCFGWIDGQVRRRDDATYSTRFTPRRARSPWSQSNVARVERLLEEGRMHDAGLAAVEQAKADGRWDAAYAGPATIEVPNDLAVALDTEPKAKEMFGKLSSQNRYAILYRLSAIKRAETRSRRINDYVAMLARGETIYPQNKKG